jgi:REP element-mobilizing transposase RayT
MTTIAGDFWGCSRSGRSDSRVEIHAFVLMDNHCHLVARTPEPNLSHAVPWLDVSCSGRFNGAHQRIGHVFAGRYRAIVIQDERGVCEVNRLRKQLSII